MNRQPLLALCLVLFLAAPAAADQTGGQLVALTGDETHALPMLRADFQVGVRGDLASVVLTQVFQNPYATAIHARYIFPLPANAAVHAMRLITGDEMIEAEIRTKPEARRVFETAKRQGKQAALLNQERPNVFTQEVANLMPGAPIRVELEYAHAVPKQDGAYKLHIPTVVGPRFIPGDSSPQDAEAENRAEPTPLEIGVWNLPASPPVASPRTVDRSRIAVRVDLDGGVTIQSLESPSHAIVSEERSPSQRIVELAEGRTLDDQDFELHYELGGSRVAAGLTTYAKDGDGFLSLLIEPPAAPADDAITAREMVFVLDCSGSMAGVPLDASKRFMRRTLREMRPKDSFRIVRFSDRATEWTEVPMPATPQNLLRGERYVNALRGGGGTHMASGIRRALAPPVPEGSLRIVVFLTDGYIGNDIDIVRLLESQRGDARLFSFGIGNSVNRYLIEEMARVGRGAARVVRPTEDSDLAADELVQRLAAPVLTDIEVDWGDAVVREVSPSTIPDLFLGHTVRVLGRYDRGAETRVVVRGKIAGKPVALPLDITLPDRNDEIAGEALPIVWARAQVKDRMARFLQPEMDGGERTRLQSEVTALGLAHRLVTQWTSFVAVSKRVVNPEGAGWPVDVPVAQVKDVPDTAYPPGALAKHASLHAAAQGSSMKVPGQSGGFDAFSGPEPSTWLALLAIAAFGGLWFRRRLSVTLRNESW